ncbi:MAG: NifB/NifX family molybdenum-iron cluster-binding protein [Candidatus Njordarchaeota archaeon]
MAQRIAVPADGESLDSNVFEHFGRAPYYVLIDIENDKITDVRAIRNPLIEHKPGDIPGLLQKNNVSVVICRGVGRRAREYFRAYSIEAITGASGKIRDIVEAYIKGELRSIDYTPKTKWKQK